MCGDPSVWNMWTVVVETNFENDIPDTDQWWYGGTAREARAYLAEIKRKARAAGLKVMRDRDTCGPLEKWLCQDPERPNGELAQVFTLWDPPDRTPRRLDRAPTRPDSSRRPQ